MKREIKFRGKRIDTGEWVYGMYFISPLTDENSGTNPDAGWFFLTGETRHCISTNMGNGGVVYVVDPDTIGQFTGQKDSEGKDIYEDDIIQQEFPASEDEADGMIEETNPVEFKNAQFEMDSYPLFVSEDFHAIVIGNIHDNPGLLN